MESSNQFQSVQAYVPHRGAMLLIDQILELGDEHAIAQVRVPTDGLFVRDGSVPAWVGIEYMAQTISAWSGGRSVQQGEQAKIGFLLGSRRYEALQPIFPAGSTLRIEVRCEMIGQNGLGMFDARILSNEDVLAKAKVTVFEPANGPEFMQQLNKRNSDE